MYFDRKFAGVYFRLFSKHVKRGAEAVLRVACSITKNHVTRFLSWLILICMCIYIHGHAVSEAPISPSSLPTPSDWSSIISIAGAPVIIQEKKNSV